MMTGAEWAERRRRLGELGEAFGDIGREGADGPETLAAFAALLADHIRFEETELFETAQRVLGAEALTAIQDLHSQEPGTACRPREPSATSSGG